MGPIGVEACITLDDLLVEGVAFAPLVEVPVFLDNVHTAALD